MSRACEEMLCARSANTTAMYGRIFHISAWDCETHPSQSDYRRYDRLAEVDISRAAACSRSQHEGKVAALMPSSVRSRRALQPHAYLLRGRHGAQQIFPRQLGDVRIAPASAHQLLEQRRVAIDALEPDRCVGYTVEIGSQANMIDTGDLANMLDMIGDLSKRRRRPWMLRFPFLERRLCALRLADVQPRKGRTVVACSLGGVVGLPAIAGRGDIGRRKIDHHYPAVRGHGTQHVVV